MVPDPNPTGERAAARVAEIAADDADPAWLLCDRHPRDVVAFTFVDQDGSASDVTFGQSRERSRRFAGLRTELYVEATMRDSTILRADVYRPSGGRTELAPYVTVGQIATSTGAEPIVDLEESAHV